MNSNTEAAEPTRKNERIDIELPICTKSITLAFMMLVKCVTPWTLAADPTLAKARRETLLPTCKKLSMDNADPNLTQERADKLLPTVTNCRIEVISDGDPAPIFAAPNTDMPLPRRNKSRTLKEEPPWMKSRTLAELASLVKDRQLTLLPR
jgi:hypothetical protein